MTDMTPGLFLVLAGRAVHFPQDNDSRPDIWARAGHVMDLRNSAVWQLVKDSKQLHKLTPIDAIPRGAFVATADLLPTRFRDRLREIEGVQADASKPLRPSSVELPSIDPSPTVEPAPESVPAEPGPQEEPGAAEAIQAQPEEAPARPPAPKKGARS